MACPFRVLCWNPAGSKDEGMADIRKIAYKNELKDEPDLVFLQEVTFKRKNAKKYHIDEDIYGTEWGSDNSHNVILYKKENISCVGPEDSPKAKAKQSYNIILYKKKKFLCIQSEEVETKVKQAYTNIASKRRCAGYISMAMETEDITGLKKEVVTKKVTKILEESKLKPLPQLTTEIENVWEDTDLKMDRDRIKYLAGCIKGADTNENDRIKALLDKHATMALLQVKDSPKEKILAVSYHGPRHSPENERALHLLLQVIKEICRLLEGCPVLLAGDFNMELWNEEGWLIDYLLSDYKPRPYDPTEHRKKAKCIDHILLWDDGQRDYTCSLENVKPKMIDITDDMRINPKDQDEKIKLNICIAMPLKTDDQTDWEKTHDGEKPAKLAKMQGCLVKKVAEEETRKKISLHDPLRTTLQVTRRGG